MENLEGRVALISGAVSGIGLGIARAFARAGIHVALGWRREDHLAKALELFAADGLPAPLAVKLDVLHPAQWQAAVATTVARFGRLDILVNNSGVNFVGTVDKATDDDWDWVMGVNFRSIIHGVRAALPAIRAHGEGGHILNVTSMAAFLPGAEVGVYCVSKFAARGYTEVLRPTLAGENIGVSELAPGLTRSNIAFSMANRPAEFADASNAADPVMTEVFDRMTQLGMDPLLVGEKVVDGIRRNIPLILSHPEFRDEVAEEFDAIVAAFPVGEAVPPERLRIEEARRASKHGGGSLLEQV